MADPQQQSQDVDVVQHPTLGTLQFPKSMSFDERNQMIEGLERDKEAHTQSNWTPPPDNRSLLQKMRDTAVAAFTDEPGSQFADEPGTTKTQKVMQVASSPAIAEGGAAAEVPSVPFGRAASAGWEGLKEGALRTPMIGPALRKAVAAWKASAEAEPEAEEAAEQVFDFGKNKGKPYGHGGSGTSAPVESAPRPADISASPKSVDPRDIPRIPKTPRSRPVDVYEPPPRAEEPTGRWMGETGARSGTTGNAAQVPAGAGKTISNTATSGRPPASQVVTQRLADKVATAAKLKSRVVLTPEEAQALDQRMSLSKQVAQRRGMQYAAGEKP